MSAEVGGPEFGETIQTAREIPRLPRIDHGDGEASRLRGNHERALVATAAFAMMERFTGGTAEGRAKVIAEEPIGRMDKPEEIAATVVWLCSDGAGFVIGHAMVVDGGQTV